MSSLILRTATSFMLPLLLLFSVFLLLRGHNEPGGGFSGGLVAAAAFGLLALSYDVHTAAHALRVNPRRLAGAGLLISIAAGVLPLCWGRPLLTHQDTWVKLPFPGGGHLDLSTALVFDVGIYLVVIGVAMTILLALAEEES